MKTIGNVVRFNGIFLGEVSIDLFAVPEIRVKATAGFVDIETGRRFGSTTKAGGWSTETLLRLNALIDSLEADIAAEVFAGATTDGGEDTIATPIDGTPGL